MCGIAGYNFNHPEIIKQMTELLRHRGPDDEGHYHDNQVSLGHRRLSIIDTSICGRQPMHYEHLSIVYNGEIYNFLELRRDLETSGYRFTSQTDTEVVLLAYHRWGSDCVNRFNGMWAFCIYDRQKRELFLSRDRFGIKPLYYYFDDNRFVFASELKAFRPHNLNLRINHTAVNFFFYQKYIGSDLTIYENCRKLKPAENLVFNLETKIITTSSYYDLNAEVAQAQTQPLQERLDAIPEILADAVEKRLIADVPVGSFLSGGIDSSLISAIIARRHDRFNTFSIGFNESSYDEVPFSRQAADHIGSNHHVDYLTIDETLIQRLIEHMDEPFGDASVLPTSLLSQMTRKHVTVALSGDAGDETFGGYDSYLAAMIARYIPQPLLKFARPVICLLPPSDKKLNLAFKMQKFIDDYHPNVVRRHLDWMASFTNPRRTALLNQASVLSEELISDVSDTSLLALQLNDMTCYLPEDILKKVDMASMLHSLEVRVPFLDYRLAPLALALPEKCKIRFLQTKSYLKTIANDYLPRAIIHRKKRGFTVPVSHWIKSSDLIRNYLTNPTCYEHNMLNYKYVQTLFNEHLERKRDNARQLWLIFVFNFWHDKVHRSR